MRRKNGQKLIGQPKRLRHPLLGLEWLEDRTLLATMSWINASGGDWDVLGNWVNTNNASDHHVPTASDDAVINVAGITVTHSSAVADSVHSLTSQDAIILSSGSLAIGSASTINNSFNVGSGASLSLSNTTLSGTGTLTISTGATLTLSGDTINTTLANSGSVIVTSTSTVATLTTAAGSTLEVETSASGGSPTLTVTNSFTNNGTIDLTYLYPVNNGYSETLTVGSGGAGTLTNASGGLITASAGTGFGSRTINATLVNQAGGTLTANYPLTVNVTSGAAANAGTINATTGNITFNLGGTSPSLTNTGTVAIASGDTFTVSGGTFNYTSGSVGSATAGGTLSLQSTTANHANDFSDAATFHMLLGSTTVNGPGKLINVAGSALTLSGDTINTTLANSGSVIVTSTSTVATLTTAAGSTLEVETSASGGSPTLTVTNSFTNLGTIDLDLPPRPRPTTALLRNPDQSAAAAAGTLTNASGGLITASAGTGFGFTHHQRHARQLPGRRHPSPPTTP